MIVRVFRARVQPADAAEFHKLFLGEALPLVRAQVDLVRATLLGSSKQLAARSNGDSA